jgi:hypothetical protein
VSSDQYDGAQPAGGYPAAAPPPPSPPSPAWAAATSDVLAARPDEPSAPRRSWALVAGAAALVLALVGGVTYAVGALSGGGQQPAAVLPSGALGVVSIDLDPPAGQKINAFRFLRKFPSLRDHVPLDGDLREVVFDAVADGAGWQDVDFDADVAPWMGKRVALAVYPPSGDDPAPQVAVALQVTDEAKADEGLRTLSRASGSESVPVGWSFTGDYALVSTNAMVAKDLATKGSTAPLSEDPDFAADTASLEDGVVLAWADMDRAAEALGGLAGVMAPGLFAPGGATSGRATVVARFDSDDVFEVVGSSTGVTSTGSWPEHPAHGLAELPDSTAAGLALADGDTLAPRLWQQVSPLLGVMGEGTDPEELAEQVLGLHMPGDLATLLGDNLLLALDSDGDGRIHVGARITTDAAKAQAVLDRMAARGDGISAELLQHRRVAGDDLVVASTPAQVDRMTAGGSLGDAAAFRAALPDLDDAAVAVWVDPPGVEKAFAGFGEPDEDLAALAGVGATLSVPSDGASTFRLRLVAR